MSTPADRRDGARSGLAPQLWCEARRAKTASSGGVRPAPVSEVAGPQCAATTVGYVAAVVPLLITPPLGAVGVDRPLAAVLLALKEEDERLKADRTGGGWAEAAGRVYEEEEKEEEEEEKGPNLPVVPPHLAPSALENLDILLYEPFRLWQSCPVFGCCFDSGYMYMRRYWRHLDDFLVFTHRWTSDPRSILQAIWTLCQAPCWQLAVRCLSCLRSI